MGFQKGHKAKGGGRKKGTKNGEGMKTNGGMDTFNYGVRHWVKKSLKSTFDIDEVDYYLYNDLDITELMDEKKLPSNDWKSNGKKDGYNLNTNMKNKKEE